ncbi:MAG: SlyX family protein [Spirochaetaceae bacterium]|nr:SlyX family protein [Spirochaetaceae bacterium]MBR6566245.1 SlyX family protein [Spirochaetaceae bacterium]
MNQEQHIINLEIKISYLEDFVQQLQGVVLEQGAVIERLVAENQRIKTKLMDMAGQLQGDIPNRRPPHY